MVLPVEGQAGRDESAGPTLTAALAYVARGWAVFPIQARGKRPLTEHGVKDASKDETLVRAWWSRWPDANLAIACGEPSGVDVVDVDRPRPEKGKTADGLKTIGDLEALHGGLIETLAARTGGGGEHLFLRHREGTKNREDGLPGVDVKSTGGYVVLPPSVHESGNAYEWIGGDASIEVKPWPDWLWDAIFSRGLVSQTASQTAPAAPGAHREVMTGRGTDAYGREALRGLVEELSAVQPGGRDGTRNRIAYRAGRLVAEGRLSREDALEGIVGACVVNGLVAEEGEEEIRKRTELGILAGEKAGPPPGAASRGSRRRPAAPRPGQVAVDVGGVEWPEPLTDIGNGMRLVRAYGEDLRHSRAMGWLVWNEQTWDMDRTGEVSRCAKASALEMVELARKTEDKDVRKLRVKHAIESQGAARIRAAIEMASTELSVVVRDDAVDSKPMLLTVENGVVDLRTGKLHPHERRHLLTKKAFVRFDAAATCPTWITFLRRVFDNRQPLIDFIQRAAGYSLSGDTTAQCFFLLHGSGSNGKSTFLRVLSIMLGDLATNAEFSSFLASPKQQVPGPRGDLARLAGARLVTAAEPDSDARFSESTIKQITGGEPITCAYKFKDEFQFVPQFKLWLGANHKPRIRGTDHAIWRRVMLVPFDVRIPDSEKDPHLVEKLVEELPGILSWALHGCLEWQRRGGLDAPDEVLASRAKYQQEQDALGDFLQERCHVAPTLQARSGELYKAYLSWCEGQGDKHPLGSRTFSEALETRDGVTKKRDERGARFDGIALRGGFTGGGTGGLL